MTGNNIDPVSRSDRTANDAEDAAAFYARLSQDLLSDHGERATLDRICELAMRVIRPADFCGITVRRRRGRLETLAQTDGLAGRCDELQYELNEGPCVDSALEAEPFLIISTADDERWPQWGPKAAALGARSLISAQLDGPPWHSSDDPLGAVNLYSRHTGAFGVQDLRRLRIFTVHAANALATARMIGGLDEAVAARHRIGMAQGILMQRYGLGADAAFEFLQRCASTSNIKLRDLASELLETGELPEASHPIIPTNGRSHPTADRG